MLSMDSYFHKNPIKIIIVSHIHMFHIAPIFKIHAGIHFFNIAEITVLLCKKIKKITYVK